MLHKKGAHFFTFLRPIRFYQHTKKWKRKKAFRTDILNICAIVYEKLHFFKRGRHERVHHGHHQRRPFEFLGWTIDNFNIRQRILKRSDVSAATKLRENRDFIPIRSAAITSEKVMVEELFFQGLAFEPKNLIIKWTINLIDILIR